MLLACRTNVAHWKSSFCLSLDQHLQDSDVGLIDLPWKEFELVDGDRNHFAPRGFESFGMSLGSALVARNVTGDVLLIADSTVDYLNNEKRVADSNLTESLAQHGIRAAVLSQSGSGFSAMRADRKDFTSLAAAYLRGNSCWRTANWVVVGGWNDEHCGDTLQRVKRSVDELFGLRHVRTRRQTLAQRYS